MMFLFTDNSTPASALFKGNMLSQKLFNMILRFQKIQIAHDAEIVVSHVAGTRMIAQGTDTVSRGALNQGVTTGLEMLSLIPLHLGAIHQNLEIPNWIKSQLGKGTEFLTPDTWVSRSHSHDGGHYDAMGFWWVEM
jgi:hypothetical protein